jgi:hypothetical protein
LFSRSSVSVSPSPSAMTTFPRPSSKAALETAAKFANSAVARQIVSWVAPVRKLGP